MERIFARKRVGDDLDRFADLVSLVALVRLVELGDGRTERDHVENPRDFLSQRSKVKSQKSESGIQSRETAKKDSDEETARRDSAEDLTGGGGKLHYGIIA